MANAINSHEKKREIPLVDVDFNLEMFHGLSPAFPGPQIIQAEGGVPGLKGL